MANQKLKIMLSMMHEIDKGNYPKFSDYGITVEEFGNIVDMCKNEGYIEGGAVSRGGQGNKAKVVWLEGSRLTLKGLQYLEDNSVLMKTYRGLKELRDWLPF